MGDSWILRRRSVCKSFLCRIETWWEKKLLAALLKGIAYGGRRAQTCKDLPTDRNLRPIGDRNLRPRYISARNGNMRKISGGEGR